MPFQDLDLLLRLLLAHFVSDFLTGTEISSSADGSSVLRTRRFYVHLILVGGLSYLFAGLWSNWWLPLIILSSHGAIDWIRVRTVSDSTATFLIDQLLHSLMILIAWILATSNSFQGIVQSAIDFLLGHQLTILAYIIVTIPGGILIGHLTSRWREEVTDPDAQESLQDAGKWIGMLERALVLTFVLVGEWRAIGFLLAAKSVFRFGELKDPKDRKRTEYILIGTLLSFTFAILVGILTSGLLS